MAYVLETITPEDQGKILKDAECDERKKKALIRRGYFNKDEPPRDWAIDRIQNSYLFWAPRPPMNPDYHCYFYFNDFLYALRFKSKVDCVVYFDDAKLPNLSLLPSIKQEIANAFLAYDIIQPYTSLAFAEEI